MKYRREIDGLRALAVLPVLAFHASPSLLGGGFVGVDVFFVISGYLITGILLDEIASGTFSITRFYERRARRILPALTVVLLATAFAAWWLLMPADLAGFGRSLMAVPVFGANILFWSESGYFDTAVELKPLLHTWSLGVEEQFYVLFPLALLGLRRVPTRTALLILAGAGVASLALADWASTRQPAAAFFLLPTRAWELLFGAIVAGLARHDAAHAPSRQWRQWLSLLGLMLIAYAALRFSQATPFPGRYALIPVLGTCFVIAFAKPDTVVGALLGTRPMVGIGLISYSAYLWHQPLFALARHRSLTEPAPWLMTLLGILSLLLAYATWRFIEVPARTWRKPSPTQAGLAPADRRGTPVLALAVISSVALVGLGLLVTLVATNAKGFVPAYARAERIVGKEVLDYAEQIGVRQPCDGRLVDDARVESCTFGAERADSNSVDLILWGDSLAGALLPGLDREFKARGLRGVMFGMGGCPPVPGISNMVEPACQPDVHRTVLRAIASWPGSVPVLLHGNLLGAALAGNIRIDGQRTSVAAVASSLATARATLNAAGKRLIVLEQGPYFAQPAALYLVKTALRGKPLGPSVTRQRHNDDMAHIRPLREVVDDYVETDTLFCDALKCPAVADDGRLLFYDTNHVTKEQALVLARFALARLDRTNP